ncbi:hypothetical protein ARMGADRAFT_752908 [Armillaria gallica]|uniref:Uncharacterized protein n=1 Tax=Armillaria gallica TaxID=47427 RepID=A0A2H3E8C5_ARMGA|nr:hypothetical protein ARMGADRAFT_752908 [Armillaria gallica]
MSAKTSTSSSTPCATKAMVTSFHPWNVIIFVLLVIHGGLFLSHIRRIGYESLAHTISHWILPGPLYKPLTTSKHAAAKQLQLLQTFSGPRSVEAPLRRLHALDENHCP